MTGKEYVYSMRTTGAERHRLRHTASGVTRANLGKNAGFRRVYVFAKYL